MVLVKELTAEELDRHHNLIKSYASTTMGSEEIEIDYLGNGQQKGVYRVKFDEKHYIAAAALRSREGNLVEEYMKLHHLYDNAPEFFPNPIAHYRSPHEEVPGELLIMELLPHTDLDVFRLENLRRPNLNRRLSYELGKAVASVAIRTGHYSSEPHDGNILGLVLPEERDNGTQPGTIELKFCDAIQFLKGDVEAAARSILVDRQHRREAFTFIRDFRKGVAESVSDLTGVTYDTAYKSLDFMREYNDIF